MNRPCRKAVVVTLAVLGVPLAAAAQPSQPIRYSHEVHVTENRIDCRFCHSSAMRTASAGIPPVEKCMNCHRVIATDKPEVRKIARYWAEKKPIPWNRVTELPDFVYFPHYRMVNAGVPCLTCHPGQDKAGAAVQRLEFTMGFCLKCHRSRGVSIDCWTCHI